PIVIPCSPTAGTPALSHEWGNLTPFALRADQATDHYRDGNLYRTYLDPGPPPYLDTLNWSDHTTSMYKYGFVMNIIWHSFHNNDDGVMIDASPNSVGGLNFTDVNQLPQTFEDYQNFYNLMEGGVDDPGHTINPATGAPYEVQLVPHKDFTRVLSQYWADGPSSETPPGHWFKLFNDVSSNPLLQKRWMGQGEILDDMDWYVRGYFTVGAGVHDAAIACWGAKGYYDYTRPIMAIRWMGSRGQCTDSTLSNYHPAGLPLIPGYIEVVGENDPLALADPTAINKIKVFSWRGPVAATGEDGAGWLLAERWWTYQAATFVTPPFAGYYSGHSTYSRTAAEIMTLITGDEYFPGGMAEYDATPGYLIADSGPSVEVKLQWATYRDASDQCSLSRIYGGLHPPQDDIPGRVTGLIVGPQVVEKANEFIVANL
ncbi:MAG: vanadium-dependent haloperoxidase, partial [Flavobacteriales bacterium]